MHTMGWRAIDFVRRFYSIALPSLRDYIKINFPHSSKLFESRHSRVYLLLDISLSIAVIQTHTLSTYGFMLSNLHNIQAQHNTFSVRAHTHTHSIAHVHEIGVNAYLCYRLFNII